MKKFLSLVLALVMTMSLVTVSAGAKDFTDASKVTYTEAAEVMKAIGVIDGFEDGSFKPTEGLTRAQAAKIISNMILGPATADAMKATAAPFKDVPASHWAAGYIAYCASEGIINGVGNGKFDPNGALTGFAFMKMLLGALGYDAEVESYVGANWAVNVAKRAIQLGLDDGLVSNLNGAKPATREEACLYALNTLKTPMVEYENTSSVTIGDVVIKNSSKAKEITLTKDNGTIDKTGKLEFAEKYFKKLSLKAVDNDEMGRPANQWSYENWKETYAKAADYTHMGDTKIYKIYDALGLSDKIAADKIEVWTDGKPDGTASYDLTNKGDYKDEKFGKGAAELSLYLKKNDSGTITGMTMVIVNTYIGKVTKVATNEDGERYVQLATKNVGNDKKFVTDKFAKDDWVLFTIDTKPDVTGDTYTIQSATLAEKMTGKLTMITDGKYVIDGTTYKVAPMGKKNIGADVDVKDTVDFYLADGMIIKIDEAEDSDVVAKAALVLDVWGAEKATDNGAKLLLSDGTVKRVVTQKDYKNGEVVIPAGTVVTYSVNDKNEYKLTKSAASKDLDSGLTMNKNQTVVRDKNVDDKTIYVYDIGNQDTVKTYVGYKNAPATNDHAASVAVFCKPGKTTAAVVFVQVASATAVKSASEDYVIIAAKPSLGLTKDGDNEYYEYNAVVDGKVTTVKVDANNGIDWTAIHSASGTACITNNWSVDSDGLFDVNNDDALTGTPIDANTVEVKGSLISLDGENHVLAKDVLVVTVDDGKIAVITLDEIDTQDDSTGTTYDCIKAVKNSSDHEIDLIVLQLHQVKKK